MLSLWTLLTHEIHPFVFQGPRGNDGDSGTQGVAGATVSFVDTFMDLI